MTYTRNWVLGVVVVIALATYILISQQTHPVGSATSGLPGVVASTTALRITNARTLIAATSTCVARIISTNASGLMLSFSDTGTQNSANASAAPNGSDGFWQGPSTTVAYDSGLYGCGAIYAVSSGATATDTVSVVQ